VGEFFKNDMKTENPRKIFLTKFHTLSYFRETFYWKPYDRDKRASDEKQEKKILTFSMIYAVRSRKLSHQKKHSGLQASLIILRKNVSGKEIKKYLLRRMQPPWGCHWILTDFERSMIT
jgi:hypothetical protein